MIEVGEDAIQICIRDPKILGTSGLFGSIEMSIGGARLGNFGDFTCVESVLQLLRAIRSAPVYSPEQLVRMLSANYPDVADEAGTLPPSIELLD